MRLFVFIVLVGCAVKCDDASYYVIEMPEDPLRQNDKTFRVYWNVPTMQCRSKKIPFEGLLEQFGIIQNSGDSFRGEKIAILYDPGLFPALLKNETSGKFKFRNGGVPHEGDLEKHLQAFRATLEQIIPDKQFSGLGVIDFESWRPVFRQNFGILVPYKDISYQIERKLHWFWTEKAIQARARQRFEESARAFMQTTLAVAKQMRPRALWGYYGFPYCFNVAVDNPYGRCAKNVNKENDGIDWLWSESTALFPSVYTSKNLTKSQLISVIRGRVWEAARVRKRGTPVLPYFWFRYRDGGFMSQYDLDAAVQMLHISATSGFIIWGSSNDVNTVEKCEKLLKYTTEVLGPTIARFTKPKSRRNSTDDSETTENPVSNTIGLTTWRPVLKDHQNSSNNPKQPAFDPEYHWDPPENYTQDIVHYVEQEFHKKPLNKTKQEHFVLTNSNKSFLMEFILNLFKEKEAEIENDGVFENNNKDQKQKNDTATSTKSVENIVHSLKSSTLPPNVIITKNPLEALVNNMKNMEDTKTKSDVYLTSTYKLNNIYYLSTTTPSVSTQGYPTHTERVNEKRESSTSVDNSTVTNVHENITTTPLSTSTSKNLTNEYEDILKDLNELLSAESELVLETTVASKNMFTEDGEIIDEFLALGTDLEITVSEPPSKNLTNESLYDEHELFSSGDNLTFNYLENITETILDTEEGLETSTSQDLIILPLSKNIEDNLSTVIYEEPERDDRFDYSTQYFTENFTASDTTTNTPVSFENYYNRNTPTSNDKETFGYVTESATSNYQNLESTTGLYSKLEETVATRQFDEENMNKYSLTNNDDVNRTSVLTSLAIEKNKNATSILSTFGIEENINRIKESIQSKNIELEIGSTTDDELTTNFDSSTPDTRSTTEFVDFASTETVPDSIMDYFSTVENLTNEVTSSTDGDQVSGSAHSASAVSHHICILLSLFLLRLWNTH